MCIRDRGDIGNVDGSEESIKQSYTLRRLQDIFDTQDRWVLHAYLELYLATKNQKFLNTAQHVADVILDKLYENSLFIRKPKARYARVADETPLAILRLSRILNNVGDIKAESLMPRDPYIRSVHKNFPKQWDQVIYLGKTVDD